MHMKGHAPQLPFQINYIGVGKLRY